MRTNASIRRRLASALFSAAIGSAVFSLYFLFVNNIRVYLQIQVSSFIGASIVAVAIQVIGIGSRLGTSILCAFGGVFGGVTYSFLSREPLLESASLGFVLGLIVAVVGIWHELRMT